ncbi:hypothetical protein ACVWW2_006214 [Bradyrhizobium sp. LM4.3]
MDAVGTNQNVPARGVNVRAGAIEEISGDAALVLGESTEAAAGVDGLRPEPLLDGPMNDALKAAAVDRELRNIVPGVDAAGLTPDLLAVTVEVIELVGTDRDIVKLLEQPEARQLAHGMRQRVDADAKLADGVGLLEYLASQAPRAQHQCGGETTDTATDDNRFHRPHSTRYTPGNAVKFARAVTPPQAALSPPP